MNLLLYIKHRIPTPEEPGIRSKETEAAIKEAGIGSKETEAANKEAEKLQR